MKSPISCIAMKSFCWCWWVLTHFCVPSTLIRMVQKQKSQPIFTSHPQITSHLTISRRNSWQNANLQGTLVKRDSKSEKYSVHSNVSSREPFRPTTLFSSRIFPELWYTRTSAARFDTHCCLTSTNSLSTSKRGRKAKPCSRPPRLAFTTSISISHSRPSALIRNCHHTRHEPDC